MSLKVLRPTAVATLVVMAGLLTLAIVGSRGCTRWNASRPGQGARTDLRAASRHDG
jgi:hypothetical protein